MSQESSGSARGSNKEPARIGLDEFTEVTVRSVVRALGVRQGPEGEFKLPFPSSTASGLGPRGRSVPLVRSSAM